MELRTRRKLKSMGACSKLIHRRFPKGQREAYLNWGTLGAGNHYCEIQVVEEIFDEHAAARMGIDKVGQVCVMIHSGSRGLGHQVATDALTAMGDCHGKGWSCNK